MRRLGDVLSAATQVLGVDSAGLMLLDEHDVFRVVGATDDAGRVLERGQQLLGIGPAIDTHRTGRSVTVDDLTRNTDYAPLSHLLHGSPDEPAALPGGAGVRAVLSAPITIRGEVIGTLNGIRARPTPWTAQDIRAAQAYAGILGVLLRLGAPARERLGSTLHDDHEHDNEHGYPAQR